MSKHKVTISLDAETKQQIEAAATEKHISVSEYLLAAAQRQLVEDGELQTKQVDSERRTIYDPVLLQDLDELHAIILARRNGEPIDIDAIIELVRSERDAELFDLR